MKRVATAAAATVLSLAALTPAALADAPESHVPSPGSPGLGDPLFPTLGNGGYDVRHYDLTFDYTPVAKTFTGKVEIRAKATQALSSFNLDFDRHTVDSITVNGRPATWSHDGGELVVTPAEPLRHGRPFDVTVAYHGVGTGPYAGLSGWNFGSDGGFASAAQASRADTFLPVNDHPSGKATWTFRVSAPPGYVATGNGVLTGTSEKDGRTVWTFEAREPMASELLGIAVVKGVYREGRGPRGLPLRHVIPAGQEEKYGPIADLTGEQVAWAEKRFGRFPFSTYGIHVYDGYKAALENQTLSLFGTNWFNRPDGTTKYTTTMIHELVHQWFGDSVTPKTWQDAWLNEGPAVYYAAVWGEEQGWDRLDDKMRTVYGKLDAVRAKDGPPGRPKGLGGYNIYDGGALVLYALRLELGDDPLFDRVMRTWVQRNEDGNASTEDFVAHTAKITKRAGIDAFLRSWLYDEKNPPMPRRPDWSAP
ncbi:M1 family metallopeptidase [Bailinhaonella thermotolerans]|uniref:Aminopeptidase N n=1 Tax=Bailinhaonella thermotolerans TaxID=1070861 RepID=A0A3A4AZ48_9ACTN|nr:M1 family metallopeptidase [Bailinhaonella thermotolerans]RJL32796.1 M1 family peptidase [Bailinhaonella thermotolerans]